MSKREAQREVDLAHADAAHRPDPVAFMRARQADAERRWFALGHHHNLDFVRAFDESLDRGRS